MSKWKEKDELGSQNIINSIFTSIMLDCFKKWTSFLLLSFICHLLNDFKKIDIKTSEFQKWVNRGESNLKMENGQEEKLELDYFFVYKLN